jgi:hypothetical protein
MHTCDNVLKACNQCIKEYLFVLNMSQCSIQYKSPSLLLFFDDCVLLIHLFKNIIMKKILIKSFCLLLFAVTGIQAQQWAKITALPETEFTMIQKVDGIIYAASGNMLYTSSDWGQTWQDAQYTNINGLIVYAFTKFNNRLYLGTSQGVFSTSVNQVHQPWNFDINTLPVTSFAEKDNILYASVEGFGVMKLMNGTAWIGFSNGLPSYSMSVTKILSTPADLLAFAGANGTFYRYNFALGEWTEDYYIDGIAAGLHVDDAKVIGNTIYVSRYNKVLRSDDLGNNWVHDQQGLSIGQNRHLYEGNSDLYCITTEGTSTTFISKRPKTETNTSWAVNLEQTAFYTFDLLEQGDKLFAAAGDGLYVKNGTLGVNDPLVSPAVIKVYPNPSADGKFIIESDTPVNDVMVYDASGRLY